MSDKTVIQLRVQFPMMERPDRAYAVQLDHEHAKCLLPLPQNHDFILDPRAAREAVRQREERKRLRGMVMQQLSDALDKIFAEEDTVNGFKRSELTPLWPVSGAGSPQEFRQEYPGHFAAGVDGGAQGPAQRGRR